MARTDPLELWRARFNAGLFLYLAMLGVGARASMPMIQETTPLVTTAKSFQPMPMTGDCIPCALCHFAAPPSTQGFSSECREPDEPVWRIHAAPASTAAFFDTGGDYARLPARILHCRWLD